MDRFNELEYTNRYCDYNEDENEDNSDYLTVLNGE